MPEPKPLQVKFTPPKGFEIPKNRPVGLKDPDLVKAIDAATDGFTQEQRDYFKDQVQTRSEAILLGDGSDGILDMDQILRDAAAMGDAPNSWIIKGNSTPDLDNVASEEEESIRIFMWILQTLFTLTRVQKLPKRRQAANRLWSACQDARVFHFNPAVLVDVRHQIDLYVTETLAGLKWQGKDAKDRPPPEESEHLLAVTSRARKLVDYPDRLPFPCTFIGVGIGVKVPHYDILSGLPDIVAARFEEAYHLGYLLTAEGNAWYFNALQLEGEEHPSLYVAPVRDEDGWRRGYGLDPWVISWFVRTINEHRQIVLETAQSPGLRKKYKDRRKNMGLKADRWAYVPPPYYVLRLTQQVIRETVQRGLPKNSPGKAYRTDVRAHERCRVARGPLPLDPKLEQKLRKRGYVVHTVDDPQDATLRRLMERGVAFKRSDEWIAVLTSWVREHMTSNNQDLPYVPALRVPGKVKTRSVEDAPDALG